MRRTNLLPQPYRLVVVLLCLFPIGQFSAVPDNKETARQTAADANEHALTLPERQEALTKLNEAARQFIDAGETVEAARTLNRVGRLQSLLNEPHDALESFQHALALLNKASVAEVKIDSLNGQAVALIFVQELVRAEMVLKKSLLLSNQTGYTAGKAQALLTLSDAQNYKNHALAMETAQSALVLWESLRNREGIARTFAQIGRCYMAQNMLLEATQNYGKALQIWRELNNPSEQARVLIMFGFIEYRKAEWQSSISYLTQAQGLIDESAEPVMRGQIAAGLAEAFNESGMPETGLGHFQDALESYRKSKDPHLVMIANRGLGVTYAYLGKYPEALDHLHQALVGLKPDSLNAAQNYEPIGMIHLKTGDSAVALKYLRLALSIYEKAANPKEAAQVKALMARVFEQQGQLERARHHYQQALKTFVESLDRQNQADALYGLGRLELRAGNLDTAEHYIKQSIAFTEDMRRVSRGSDLAAAFSATVYERYQTYIDCLMRQHHAHPDRGYAALALETSELARARSLSEMLSSTATAFAPGVDPQLVAQEKSLSQSLRVKENSKIRMLGGKYKREGLASLENELARLEQDYRKVAETIKARYPAFEKLTRPGAWSLQQIQSQVIADDQTVLLEYSLGADRSYVWAITRDSLQWYELPPQEVIAESAKKVYELLATEPKGDSENQLSRAAHELSSIILSPVASHLNKHRIIVVADGALHYIPFQFLPAPNNKELLVSNYEVINAPSASVLGQLRLETSRRPPAPNVLAAFGDPVFAPKTAQQSDSLARLENDGQKRSASREIQPTSDVFDPASFRELLFARIELANLRSVAGEHTLMATQYEANREKVRTTDLTQYSILHFATHGILDPAHPEKSGLILSTLNRQGQAQNGLLGLHDIYSLNAPVELVVMSACRTGLGKDLRGEGLIGLTRGFIYAGSSSVVASLWKVDDEATAELMKRFYTNMLRSGMKPPEALRAAQNSIRQEPQWRAPYYWAAFTLQGDYLKAIASPATSATTYKKLATIVCLTLLATAVFWYFSRKTLFER